MQIQQVANADFPTAWGHFRILGFEGRTEHPDPCNVDLPAPPLRVEGAVALVMGDLSAAPPICRIHSQCLTGDVFHSLRCDCRQQLELALDTITAHGSGILLYEAQEGRGIGLINKMKAYKLQEQGYDTVEANEQLGFADDLRDYGIGAQILRYLGITKLKLISNNPRKRAGLSGYGIEIVDTVPIEIKSNPHNENYLRTKRDKLGHEILK